jgi:spore coat protein CotH
MRRLIFLLHATLLACCATSMAHAQDGDLVFNDSVLHQLRIVTPLVNWFDTLENDYALNAADPLAYPEIYRPCDATFDGQPILQCGFREKGNFSNQTAQGRKQPLKLAFDAVVEQRFDGLKKINLHNFTNDPSLVHDVVSYALFRAAGIPAPRTAYTQVYVNGEYLGLYLLVENVDKTFLKRHYGSQGNDGMLFKTGRGVRVLLNWLGPDSSAYQDQGLTLNTDENRDWSGLIDFLDLLNNDFGPGFQQRLEAKFDVHGFLKVLAVEKLVRSWDSYAGGGNNFYLYAHPDGQIRWIPWDMNETFQDIRILRGSDWTDGYLIPKTQDERPLLKRIFEIEEYRQAYFDAVCTLITGAFTLEELGPLLVMHHAVADTAYRSDPNKLNTYESFARSLTETHRDDQSLFKTAYEIRLRYPGIFPLIEDQRDWAQRQLAGWAYPCALARAGMQTLDIHPNPADDIAYISNPEQGFDYAQVQLYDLSGREVYHSGFVFQDGVPYPLHLGQVSPGLYLVVKRGPLGEVMGRGKLMVR